MNSLRSWEWERLKDPRPGCNVINVELHEVKNDVSGVNTSSTRRPKLSSSGRVASSVFDEACVNAKRLLAAVGGRAVFAGRDGVVADSESLALGPWARFQGKLDFAHDEDDAEKMIWYMV